MWDLMSALVASILLPPSFVDNDIRHIFFTCFAHITCSFNNREKFETYFHPTLLIMYFHLPPSIPNFFKLTMFHATLVCWSQETSKRSTKHTYHKVHAAQEKNQKKRKEQRTSKQQNKTLTHKKIKIITQKMLIMHVKSPNKKQRGRRMTTKKQKIQT